jgi:hypothetical protein
LQLLLLQQHNANRWGPALLLSTLWRTCEATRPQNTRFTPIFIKMMCFR